jgi:hypothetical protein
MNPNVPEQPDEIVASSMPATMKAVVIFMHATKAVKHVTRNLQGRSGQGSPMRAIISTIPRG